MKAELSLTGLAIVVVVVLWMCYGAAADGAEPLPPATPITAGKGDLAPVEIKLPRPEYIGTPKIVPPGVRKPSEKPRPVFNAPIGMVNLALNRPVKSSDAGPVVGELVNVTNGDKSGSDYVELAPGLQWVQIDLGKRADIYGICVWHYHKEPKIYKAVVVQVSDDPDFIGNVKTVFNNDKVNAAGLGVGKDQEYVEYYEGELMPIKDGVQGRYVRLYSKGNLDDDMNHYVEVEVYGIAK